MALYISSRLARQVAAAIIADGLQGGGRAISGACIIGPAGSLPAILGSQSNRVRFFSHNPSEHEELTAGKEPGDEAVITDSISETIQPRPKPENAMTEYQLVMNIAQSSTSVKSFWPRSLSPGVALAAGRFGTMSLKENYPLRSYPFIPSGARFFSTGNETDENLSSREAAVADRESAAIDREAAVADREAAASQREAAVADREAAASESEKTVRAIIVFEVNGSQVNFAEVLTKKEELDNFKLNLKLSQRIKPAAGRECIAEKMCCLGIDKEAMVVLVKEAIEKLAGRNASGKSGKKSPEHLFKKLWQLFKKFGLATLLWSVVLAIADNGLAPDSELLHGIVLSWMKNCLEVPRVIYEEAKGKKQESITVEFVLNIGGIKFKVSETEVKKSEALESLGDGKDVSSPSS